MNVYHLLHAPCKPIRSELFQGKVWNIFQPDYPKIGQSSCAKLSYDVKNNQFPTYTKNT